MPIRGILTLPFPLLWMEKKGGILYESRRCSIRTNAWGYSDPLL